MQPRIFQQRLLELAAEYESLHARARPDGTTTAARRSGGPTVPDQTPPPNAPVPPAGRADVALGGLVNPAEGSQRTIVRGPEAPAARRSCRLPPDRLGAPAGPADGRAPGGPSGSAEAGARKGISWSPSALQVGDRATSPENQVLRGSHVSVHSEESSLTISEVSSIRSGPSAANTDLHDADARRTIKLIRATATSASNRIDERPLARFVKSAHFTVALASLIIVSAVLIGIETQVLAGLSYQRAGSEQVLTVLSILNYMVTFLFTAEMVTRLYVFRIDFFIYERMWNCFDLIILFLALVEIALEIVVRSLAGTENSVFDGGGTAKMMRLIRLTRLLRLVRTFRQLKPLRMLVRSIMAAGKSVFWALLLLFMIVYVFGVVLTQAVTEHTEGGDRIEDDNLISYYGDLFRSMLSLSMAVSGGISWIELTTPLEGMENSMWTFLFLVYIAIVYFFILNVVTGVFCQNAIEGAQADLDMSIDAQLREKQMHAQRLGMLFQEMNQSGDTFAELTADDLDEQLAKPKVQSWFRSLDIDAKQTWKLFKIIDADNSGRVSLEEFVEGCLQLRGPATRVDVESLKWDIRGASKGAWQDNGKKSLMSQRASVSDLPREGDHTVTSAGHPGCKTSL